MEKIVRAYAHNANLVVIEFDSGEMCAYCDKTPVLEKIGNVLAVNLDVHHTRLQAAINAAVGESADLDMTVIRQLLVRGREYVGGGYVVRRLK
ncbi:hypothetical protein PL75_03335 [Neisseria arctica]|uniref:Uncharacterized protein n=1 Tax=Neisseria arctica TaxID=1470200 RepID=A0A0J0YSY7_9NEIS|nr:hypothetical protein [Neisseria arctica]KLT73270.1 hypothetical protein PL75_03335 [Neisseria arctica]UOO87473.1 hypothetical protein LVJ86_04310 [Neisseria arctica]